MWIPEDERLWATLLGPYLTREDVAARLHVTGPDGIDDLVRTGKVIELPTSMGARFPVFQFTETGELDPTISEVAGILADVVQTPYTIASWLKGAKPALLDGKTPIEWLAGDCDRDAVIAAAQSLATRLGR
jgi:hypothetical protein